MGARRFLALAVRTLVHDGATANAAAAQQQATQGSQPDVQHRDEPQHVDAAAAALAFPDLIERVEVSPACPSSSAAPTSASRRGPTGP